MPTLRSSTRYGRQSRRKRSSRIISSHQSKLQSRKKKPNNETCNDKGEYFQPLPAQSQLTTQLPFSQGISDAHDLSNSLPKLASIRELYDLLDFAPRTRFSANSLIKGCYFDSRFGGYAFAFFAEACDNYSVPFAEYYLSKAYLNKEPWVHTELSIQKPMFLFSGNKQVFNSRGNSVRLFVVYMENFFQFSHTVLATLLRMICNNINMRNKKLLVALDNRDMLLKGCERVSSWADVLGKDQAIKELKKVTGVQQFDLHFYNIHKETIRCFFGVRNLDIDTARLLHAPETELSHQAQLELGLQC